MHEDNGQLVVLDPGELRHLWVVLGNRHLDKFLLSSEGTGTGESRHQRHR